MSTASAVLLAAALWVGSLLQAPWWAIAGGLGLASGAVFLARRFPRAALAVAVAAMVLAGAGLAGTRLELAERGPLEALTGGGAAEVRATAVTEARPTDLGAWQLVRVDRIDERPARQRALLRHDALADGVPLGARVRMRASATALDGDGFDAHLRHLGAVAAVEPHGSIERLAPPGPALAVTGRIREDARALFEATLPPERAALLAGLTTGDRTEASPEQRDRFAAAGLSHLVVVSGKHTGLVLAVVLGLGGAAGLGFRGQRVLALVALAWFVVLVRWQPSVLRAGLVAALVLLAGLLGRGHAAPRVLAGAVVVLLLADPLLARHLGFVLSVLATAGVVTVAPAVAGRARGPRWFRWTLGATVGAQLGVTPVLLATDGGVPLASLPANLVAAPAAAVAQVLGLVAAALAGVAEPAAASAARLADPALRVVLWSAEAFTALPRLEPHHLVSPIAGVVLLAAALAPWRRAVAVAVLLVGLATAVAVGARPAGAPDGLRIRALDVGVGDALLVEAPDPAGGTARLLYDGGPQPDAASAHLRRLRVRDLDVVVASHGHLDHVAGLPEVLERVDVGALVVGASPEPPASDVAAAVHEAADAADVPIEELAAGEAFALGAARVEVLNPPRGGLGHDDLNEHSLVLRVESPDGSVLLTGDAEEGAQRRLLATESHRLPVDVLQVPHHGASTNAEGFLGAVGARVGVISVGAENPYGHPTDRTLGELAGAGTEVARTDEDGTVMVTLDGGRVHVHRRRRARARPPSTAPDRRGRPPSTAPDRRGRPSADRQRGGSDTPRVSIDRGGSNPSLRARYRDGIRRRSVCGVPDARSECPPGVSPRGRRRVAPCRAHRLRARDDPALRAVVVGRWRTGDARVHRGDPMVARSVPVCPAPVQ
ncbi:MBL fold metallo-hydrolase [Egibacter rhizosphaerae]|uniref:MBL fold metallo-hydrolase n=1 Tax=Egibacter rhizosphaerae TaxID=1670831 RepID=A0A411YBS8_9ACTN|nr:ComEC/Rec2 family competence protein [Egibacter rhizosphaerae]QBI18646.1 MBL fold metallo-hydrolase [Egibacter rhizosphaerae]